MNLQLIRRALPSLVLICASSLLALIICEALLRVAGYSYPSFYQYDFNTGVRHRGSVTGWFRKEAEVFDVFNEKGIRVAADQPNHIVSVTKPASSFRIAVLGDSFTEGLQVTAHERFSQVLEDGLNSCNLVPGSSVEVINFGVSGMGQSREMALYESVVKDFSPDVVLVAVADNDFFNNIRELTGDPFSPYWELSATGDFVRDQRFQSDPTFLRKLRWSVLRQEITSYSRLLQLFTQAYVVLVVNNEGPAAWRDDATDRHGQDPAFFVSPPRSKKYWHVWNIFVAGMRAWSDLVEKDGSIFAVTSIPSHHVMRTDMWHTYRKSFGSSELILLPNYIDKALTKLANDEGFQYFPIINPMRDRAYRDNHDLYYHSYSGVNWGHMNALGHRFVGEELANQMCNKSKTHPN